MEIREFSKINRERCESPDGFNHKLSDWSIGDWMVALTGELGEAANIVKKLNRIRDQVAITANKGLGTDELVEKLVGELSDVYIYLDLTFQRLGTDMSNAIIRTFNNKSAELKCPIIFSESSTDRT